MWVKRNVNKMNRVKRKNKIEKSEWREMQIEVNKVKWR